MTTGSDAMVQSTLKRRWKMVSHKVAPFSSGIGIMADFASPLGDYSNYLWWSAGLLTGALFLAWIYKKTKNAVAASSEGLLTKSLVYCFAATVIFSGFAAAKAFSATPDKGLIVSHIPSLSDLQVAILRIEKNAQVMNRKLDSLQASVDQIKKIYTLDQIKKLAEQEIWEDVLTHLEDIEPLARDDDWQSLLEQAAFENLRDLERRRQYARSYEMLATTFEKYKTLKRSDRLMTLRNKVGLRQIEECLLASQPIQDCEPLAFGIIDYDDKYRYQLALQVGNRTTYHRFHRAGLPYYAVAAEGLEKEELCADARLPLAIVNGFGGSLREGSVQVAESLAQICVKHIKSELGKALEGAGAGSELKEVICRIFQTAKIKHTKCGRRK